MKEQGTRGGSGAEARLVLGAVLALGLGAWAPTAGAEEWAQYRGPAHNATSAERIRTAWSAQAPTQVWKKTLTSGFSSFAVSQGRAYTLVTRTLGGAQREVCVALNADTGAELWAAAIGLASYDSGAGDGDGPRSTPTVDSGRVYAFSADLNLVCLNATNGQPVWTRGLETDFDAQNIPWQNAASPVIEGDLVFLNCNSATGSTLLALRKSDGGVVWRTQTDKMTQATPVLATILDVRQIVFHTQTGLVALNPLTGAVLWRYSFSYNGTSSAASPVVGSNVVFVSAAYNKGSAAAQITRTGGVFKATQLWRKSGNDFGNHWSTPVFHQGYLYGVFGSASSTMPLKCIDMATGTIQWTQTGFGSGGVLLVNGNLLVQSEAGYLVVVKPDPTAYREVARYKALAGKSWNSPALSDGRIYARSTTEGVCLDVSVPPLRIRTAARLPNGKVQFEVGCTNGAALPTWRVPLIGVLASSDLTAQRTSWTPVTVTSRLTNGVLQVEWSPDAAPGPRFLVVNETQ